MYWLCCPTASTEATPSCMLSALSASVWPSSDFTPSLPATCKQSKTMRFTLSLPAFQELDKAISLSCSHPRLAMAGSLGRQACDAALSEILGRMCKRTEKQHG